ncbi:uncharacterized protein BT62DRAFT_1072139 [Guyanagaster necrorhizus]|uniref:Septin-type G domain-containing protein n=1 Tax=Guyanagaster necrorhizus TaxID=856835 RepID=A0A9P7W2S1_9AGAR|nr:uncharacterized protein BT62DRAFT_1072139 [Guyanagaster necrorhizus MCA 3950]KAG7451592.1 hypothetical protein BT62DRAFT_1072139 [Guyanagaster necrorhizus MCA 3950]
MECTSISTSASTIRSLHDSFVDQNVSTSSLPSSPRSNTSALPSPPDSPSLDSVSSFPSVSSSFFFSSSGASPPSQQSDHGRDSTQGLIIPSLTLPDPLRYPTPYGQTLGDIRIITLGTKGVGKSFLTKLLLEDNEDVVDEGIWEDGEYGKVMRASTDWLDRRDAHGLEKFEPARNVEIHELPGYEYTDNVRFRTFCDGSTSLDIFTKELIMHVKSMVQTPFCAVSNILDPSCDPSTISTNLVASAYTPLYTALVLLLSSSEFVPSYSAFYLIRFPDSSIERKLIKELSSYIPIIVLPHVDHDDDISPSISSFRPPSPITLRQGLFRSPATLLTLRNEAADRFFRWREVSYLSDGIRAQRQRQASTRSDAWKDKDWEASLSYDVARRLRDLERRSETHASGLDQNSEPKLPCFGVVGFDPLHFTSLFMFSISILGPLQRRTRRSIQGFFSSMINWNVCVALVGGFCIGLGIGILLR